MPFFSSKPKHISATDSDPATTATNNDKKNYLSTAVVACSSSSKMGSRYADEPECDYDRNPTGLYKLIEAHKWDEAIVRVEELPMEAMSWVSRREQKDEKKLRWRLLPLHATCIFKAPVALIEALVRAYPDGTQMKDDQGMLPVHLACRNGATKGVVLLLLDTFPESIEIMDRKDRTPLMFAEASQSQNREAVLMCFRSFMKEQKEKHEKTLAIKSKSDDRSHMSRSRKGREDSSVMQSVAASAISKLTNEVDYEHRTVLFRLVLKKDWDGAALRCKTAPDESQTWIVTKGFKGNLRFLPLHKACVLQPPESVIECLIAAYPDGPNSKDQDGWLPVHCACFYGASQPVVDTLLVAFPKGAQSKDDEGRLPIHYACLKGASVGVVENLLGTYPKGAQSKDDEGRLPIHHACSKGAPEDVINALLNSSPKGSASKDDQGRLPLHHACRKNASEKVVKALLRSYPKGAQVKDDQDKLPIHYACQHGGSEGVINILLAAFPHSINSKNGFGYTPLAEARAMDNPKMEGVISVLEKFKSENQHLLQPGEVVHRGGESVNHLFTAGSQDTEALKAQVSELNQKVETMGKVLITVAKLGQDIKVALKEGHDTTQVLHKMSHDLANVRIP